MRNRFETLVIITLRYLDDTFDFVKNIVKLNNYVSDLAQCIDKTQTVYEGVPLNVESSANTYSIKPVTMKNTQLSAEALYDEDLKEWSAVFTNNKGSKWKCIRTFKAISHVDPLLKDTVTGKLNPTDSPFWIKMKTSEEVTS